MNDLPETVTLPSGAVLTLKHAPLSEATQMLQVIALELMSVSTGLKIQLSLGDPVAMLAQLAQEDLPIDVLKNGLLLALSSKNIAGAVTTCMGRCLLDGHAIQPRTFEEPKARGDYLPTAWEVMKFNLLPFFAGLQSKFSSRAVPASSSQR